jgi:hypothetical protein
MSISIEEVFLKVIQFHNLLKLYHFQTKSYGAHKASDKLFADLADKYDQFFEIYQGKYGRIPRLNDTIVIKTVSDKEMIGVSKRFAAFLYKSTSKACKVCKNSDICNVLDEMVGSVNQFIYLLSFK